MAYEPRVICASTVLRDGGSGVRFPLRVVTGRANAPPEFEVTGFVVRHAGRVCAYVNRCPHLGTELDWQPGEFFDARRAFRTRDGILPRGAMPRRLARDGASPGT
jgi:nitrite reductase/ring-hydroxylating ferredoxin subunit